MADISLRESMKHALPSKSSIGSKRSTKIYEKKEKVLNKSQNQVLIEKSNRGRKAKETDKYVIESDKKENQNGLKVSSERCAGNGIR